MMSSSPTGRAHRRTSPSRTARIGPIVVLLLVYSYPRALSLMSNSVDHSERPQVFCSNIRGLTKEMRERCYNNSLPVEVAIEGLTEALKECQNQFTWHRWNCSSLTPNSRIQQKSRFLQQGFKETAFVYAITAAGVAHNIARSCSRGKIASCDCNGLQMREQNQWKWSGCAHNVNYGLEFSRMFLDSLETYGDIQSTVNLHNNEVGRLVLAENMETRCKCHGLSGSCEMKTCWKAPPDFRKVGKALKERFKSAVMVTQTNLGSVTPVEQTKSPNAPRLRRRGQRRLQERQRRKKHREGKRRGDGKRRGGGNRAAGNRAAGNRVAGNRASASYKDAMRDHQQQFPQELIRQLFYYDKSPNFCEQDPANEIAGTSDRVCNKNSTGNDACSSMCCGRGYSLVRRTRMTACKCRFQWCCFVHCDSCFREEWVTVCK